MMGKRARGRGAASAAGFERCHTEPESISISISTPIQTRIGRIGRIGNHCLRRCLKGRTFSDGLGPNGMSLVVMKKIVSSLIGLCWILLIPSTLDARFAVEMEYTGFGGWEFFHAGEDWALRWAGLGELQTAPSAEGPWVSASDRPDRQPFTLPEDATWGFYRVLPQPRAVQIHYPEGYVPGAQVPLVLFLHWHGSSGELYRQQTGALIEKFADQMGFAFGFPTGTLSTIGERFWNATAACCNLHGSGVDDVAFLRSIIEQAVASHGIDPTRVYLFGLSNGGFMCYRMACEVSSKIAGIAVLSGHSAGEPDICLPEQGVHVLHVHGTADAVVFYDGGVDLGPRWRQASPGAEASVLQWARFNGADVTARTQSLALDFLKNDAGNDTDRIWYEPALDGHSVELWRINGFGHLNGQVYWTALYREMLEWLMARPSVVR